MCQYSRMGIAEVQPKRRLHDQQNPECSLGAQLIAWHTLRLCRSGLEWRKVRRTQNATANLSGTRPVHGDGQRRQSALSGASGHPSNRQSEARPLHHAALFSGQRTHRRCSLHCSRCRNRCKSGELLRYRINGVASFIVASSPCRRHPSGPP